MDVPRQTPPLIPQEMNEILLSASQLNAECRYDEADAILRACMAQHPGAPEPHFHFFRLAWDRNDLLGALERGRALRERFPDRPDGYLKLAAVLRQLRRLEEAAPLIREGRVRFPRNPGFLTQAVLLAEAEGDWDAAEAATAGLRGLLPGQPIGWIQGAQSLLRGGRTERADDLLDEAIARFPNEAELHTLRATVAERQKRWEEADRRWAEACAAFPDRPAIALGHAVVWAQPLLNEQGKRNWPEVFARLRRLNAAFPGFADGFRAHMRRLRQAERLDEAEVLAQHASGRFPANADIAIEAAFVAKAAGRPEAAISVLTDAMGAMPFDPRIPAELVAMLADAGRLDEAEAACTAAAARFRFHPRLAIEYAEIAMRRDEPRAALTRWTDGAARFPHDDAFTRGIARAQLALIGRGEAPAACPPAAGNAATDLSIRYLVMQFESLGGPGMGCEFGLVQRRAGTEPLSLLRWTEISLRKLIDALTHEFEGAGTPEQTNLVLSPSGEYMLVDSRYGMLTHTFTRESAVARDELFEESCRRITFLKGKLLRDLRAARKIFVFRLGKEATSQADIAALHAALQKYGDVTLLCVAWADEQHPPGSVELVKPGLLLGHVKEVAAIEMTEAAGWFEACRAAWRLARPDQALPGSRESAPAAPREKLLAEA